MVSDVVVLNVLLHGPTGGDRLTVDITSVRTSVPTLTLELSTRVSYRNR